MTRRKIALVCVIAGLTFVGVGVLIDPVETRVYDCNPDPYYPSTCTAQRWAFLGVNLACWLVPTYLVARREAVTYSLVCASG